MNVDGALVGQPHEQPEDGQDQEERRDPAASEHHPDNCQPERHDPDVEEALPLLPERHPAAVWQPEHVRQDDRREVLPAERPGDRKVVAETWATVRHPAKLEEGQPLGSRDPQPDTRHQRRRPPEQQQPLPPAARHRPDGQPVRHEQHQADQGHEHRLDMHPERRHRHCEAARHQPLLPPPAGCSQRQFDTQQHKRQPDRAADHVLVLDLRHQEAAESEHQPADQRPDSPRSKHPQQGKHEGAAQEQVQRPGDRHVAVRPGQQPDRPVERVQHPHLAIGEQRIATEDQRNPERQVSGL